MLLILSRKYDRVHGPWGRRGCSLIVNYEQAEGTKVSHIPLIFALELALDILFNWKLDVYFLVTQPLRVLCAVVSGAKLSLGPCAFFSTFHDSQANPSHLLHRSEHVAASLALVLTHPRLDFKFFPLSLWLPCLRCVPVSDAHLELSSRCFAFPSETLYTSHSINQNSAGFLTSTSLEALGSTQWPCQRCKWLIPVIYPDQGTPAGLGCLMGAGTLHPCDQCVDTVDKNMCLWFLPFGATLDKLFNLFNPSLPIHKNRGWVPTAESCEKKWAMHTKSQNRMLHHHFETWEMHCGRKSRCNGLSQWALLGGRFAQWQPGCMYWMYHTPFLQFFMVLDRVWRFVPGPSLLNLTLWGLRILNPSCLTFPSSWSPSGLFFSFIIVLLEGTPSSSVSLQRLWWLLASHLCTWCLALIIFPVTKVV